MSGDEGNDPPEEQRTAFAPVGRPVSQPAPSEPPAPVAGPEKPERASDGRIQVGDVLNYIFEVRRFIARGGMGEVYEGVNVNTEERVAIKVMLPALAADPNVQAMFRKEARTLTRLSHPALVQYRVLAMEPKLGVLYIVTDYIDGRNLSDVLASVPRDGPSLTNLLRRLAEGLGVAHALGAVHRDVSPDNVLLEDNRLELARIIDFGIAKDLDPSKGTIIGDGFAGKLNYVAPEQLGDFGREMGPWTDVYSLALVMLAVANGRNVDMGATLVDAVDKRRAGIDVSAAPENLRPVLEAMLRANPKDRLRSMADVIGMIDRRTDAGPARPPAEAAPEPVLAAAASAPAKAPRTPSPWVPKSLIYAGGGVAALAVIGVAAIMLISPDDSTAPQEEAVEAANPLDTARTAISGALPNVPCSWLNQEDLQVADGAVSVKFGGVAGNPVAAQAEVSQAITTRNLKLARNDFADVATINPVACNALDAFRTIKSTTPGALGTDQIKWEKSYFASGRYQGQSLAIPQITIAGRALTGDIAIVGIETDGNMNYVIPSKASLVAAVQDNPETGSINPNGSITLKLAQDAEGWQGILAIYGRGPFDQQLVAPPEGSRGSDWRQRLESVAAANGWKADMVWFRVVDEVPDQKPPG